MNAKGMFVDTSICTGCKACQVACKEWNGLEGEPSHFERRQGYAYTVASNFSGRSYDNTQNLSATDWRHVKFIEQFNKDRVEKRVKLGLEIVKREAMVAMCINAVRVSPSVIASRYEAGALFFF
jgi:formate dehydrogenase iron-sulfur subunit